MATQAHRSGVMEVFIALTQKDECDVGLILFAAETCRRGSAAAHEALRLVYSRPRTWDEYSRADAAALAARLGDERAAELVRRRNAAIARKPL